MTPLRQFDITPAIDLALNMGGSLEKDRPCAKCVEAQRRLLVYFAESALPKFGFEVVRLVEKGLDDDNSGLA